MSAADDESAATPRRNPDEAPEGIPEVGSVAAAVGGPAVSLQSGVKVLRSGDRMQSLSNGFSQTLGGRPHEVPVSTSSSSILG